jgi:hypothetical protein
VAVTVDDVVSGALAVVGGLILVWMAGLELRNAWRARLKRRRSAYAKRLAAAVAQLPAHEQWRRWERELPPRTRKLARELQRLGEEEDA